jgi:hypothetical protein
VKAADTAPSRQKANDAPNSALLNEFSQRLENTAVSPDYGSGFEATDLEVALTDDFKLTP